MIESIFFQPWVWIMPIVILLLIFGGFAFVVFDWDGLQWLVAGVLWATALGTAGAYFGGMLPPYDVSYYQTYRVTGEVSSYNAALEGGGDGTFSRGFVVEVKGIDLLIWSDDQRFRTVGEGDDVNLVCGKVFNYFQAPYLDCSFGG